jgi:hypothetical protein
MKKSIFIVSLVVFLAIVAVVTTASAAIVYDVRYPDVEITPSRSTSYSPGVFGVQLYEGRKQLIVFPGWTSLPSYDNEIWRVLAGLSNNNTPVVSTDGKTRWPSPWIFPGSTQSAISHYICGDAGVLAEVKTALLGTDMSIYYSEVNYSMTVESTWGMVNTALIYSVNSGLVTYYPVKNQDGAIILNPAGFKAFMAADSFRF